MKRLALTLFISILSLAAPAAETYLKAKDLLPNDAALALNFLQTHKLSTRDWTVEIKKLDLLLRQLSEEERLMILKSELYKAILKTSRGHTVNPSTYRRTTLERLKKNLKKANDEEWGSFSRFLMEAVITDVELIMTDADYPNFLSELSSGRPLSSQSRSFKQRLDGILPWVQWYFDGSLTGLNQKLVQTSEKFLELATRRIEDLILMSEFDGPKNDPQAGPWRFFTETPKPKKEEEKNLKKELEKIDASTPTKPQAPLDEKWVPRMGPDPEYEAPEKLPEPVDDWLPQPVDDWLDDI